MEKKNWIVTLQRGSYLEKCKENGATTVRIAVEGYSVRTAGCFQKEEIDSLIARFHSLDLKWEIVFNRLWMEEELEEMIAAMEQIARWNPDGIVYMDPAVYMEACELGIEDRLIYSPDTLMTNASDIQSMLDLGIRRVVLAAEITMDEIMKITAKLPSDKVELQIHGRQVMSYSRRMLVSNYLDYAHKTVENLHERKDLYLVESTRTGKMPIIETEYGSAVYMDSTLCSIEEIVSLCDAGLTHFFIDSMFSTDQEMIHALRSYQEVIRGADPEIVMNALRKMYPALNYGKGYYYTKTNLTKEDC